MLNTEASDSTQPPLSGTMPFIPFEGKQKAPPKLDIDLEKRIKTLQVDIEQLVKRATLPKQNIPKEEYQSLVSLRNNPDITAIRSDKGGEMVLMKTTTLDKLTTDHLNDTSTYEKLKTDPTENLRKTVNSTLQEILTNRGYPLSFTNRLMTSSAKTQRFYSLPKTHKPTLKIRPIVSGKAGIYDRLGWPLQSILKPLLTKVDAHITNTKQLIAKFQAQPHAFFKDKIQISFDVCSLYTNIGVEEAIDMCLQYTQRYDLECYSLEPTDIKLLLSLLLNNNVFKYQSTIYRHIRGLAMGNRLSGTLAIIVMDRFERSHIYQQLQPASKLSICYVDDSNTVANNTQQAQNMLRYLNTKHPTIKFELALPESDGFLPILDLKMKFNEDGSMSLKHNRKTANRGITLHYQSHHPETTKRAIVRSEFQRATEYSTPDNRQESLMQASTKMRSNGYPLKWLRPNRQIRKQEQASKPRFDNILRIPYVTEVFNSQVRAALKRNGFHSTRLVNPRPMTIVNYPDSKTVSTMHPAEMPNIGSLQPMFQGLGGL